MQTLYQLQGEQFVAVREIPDKDKDGVQDYLITQSFRAWACHHDDSKVPVFAWDADGKTKFSAKSFAE